MALATQFHDGHEGRGVEIVQLADLKVAWSKVCKLPSTLCYRIPAHVRRLALLVLAYGA